MRWSHSVHVLNRIASVPTVSHSWLVLISQLPVLTRYTSYIIVCTAIICILHQTNASAAGWFNNVTVPESDISGHFKAYKDPQFSTYRHQTGFIVKRKEVHYTQLSRNTYEFVRFFFTNFQGCLFCKKKICAFQKIS